jgi:hypothetical protein
MNWGKMAWEAVRPLIITGGNNSGAGTLKRV